MPQIEILHTQNKGLLQKQQALSLTLKNIDEQAADNLYTQLKSKEDLLDKLKHKRMPNDKLLVLLEPLCKAINTSDSTLSFYAVGDVSVLEDILEEIERNYFIFIQNISLNAHFSSDLEMRFDVFNAGELL